MKLTREYQKLDDCLDVCMLEFNEGCRTTDDLVMKKMDSTSKLSFGYSYLIDPKGTVYTAGEKNYMAVDLYLDGEYLVGIPLDGLDFVKKVLTCFRPDVCDYNVVKCFVNNDIRRTHGELCTYGRDNPTKPWNPTDVVMWITIFSDRLKLPNGNKKVLRHLPLGFDENKIPLFVGGVDDCKNKINQMLDR
ncbi:MAG: hypothetical protein IJ834_06635 [Paludibacteraceae bacterium]|nr:hypothetical protein [Paludibacteraceae bacterium]